MGEYKSIGCLVVCYNEEPTLPRLLDGLLTFLDADQIWLCDDGSTDRSVEISEGKGVSVIKNTGKKGYVNNLSNGLQKLVGKKNYKWVIYLDADGEHRPSDVKKILDSRTNETALIIGERDFVPRISEKIVNKIMKVLVDANDVFSGLKLVNLSRARLKENPMPWLYGVDLIEFQKSAVVSSVPIEISPRTSESRLGNTMVVNLKISLCFIWFLCRFQWLK